MRFSPGKRRNDAGNYGPASACGWPADCNDSFGVAIRNRVRPGLVANVATTYNFLFLGLLSR